MNDQTPTRYTPPSQGSSELTIELAKMLALVAPSSMTTEQQEIWLRAAIDALEDIRADEVRQISAEIRRSVTRHNLIVPAIAEKVAELRARKARLAEYDRRPVADVPALPPVAPVKPLTQQEIDKMPKWLRDMGLRVGILKREGGRTVEAA